jgi:arylsulfatase A-like enzyme
LTLLASPRVWRERPGRTLVAAGVLLAVAWLGRPLAHRLGLLGRSDERPNVLWVVLNGTRPEHLSVYGYGRLTSPWLARIGAEGVVFEHATVRSADPIENHLEMVGARGPGARPSELPLTAAEIFRDAGYETAAILGPLPLEREPGFLRGFDAVMRGPPRLFFAEVVERLGATRAATEWGPVSPATALRWLDRPTFLAGVGTRASGLTDRALGWIAGRAPFFLLVDYGDPLDPLDPPEPWRSRFADGVPPLLGFVRFDPRRGRAIDLATFASERFPRMRADERQGLVDLYDAEVAFVDSQVGRLIETLRHRGRLDRTIVVVSGDRGDPFSELERPAAAELRIPLLVRAPAHLAAGRRVGTPVEIDDVLPTLLEWTGIRSPRPAGGAGLVARSSDELGQSAR